MTRAEELGITEFPYEERDENYQLTYTEDGNGRWVKYTYDDKGNNKYFERSNGDWCKFNITYHDNDTIKSTYAVRHDGFFRETKRDENNNKTYLRDRSGWYIWEWNKYGKLTHYKNAWSRWTKHIHDDKGIRIAYEDYKGNWWSKEHFPNTKCPFHCTQYKE